MPGRADPNATPSSWLRPDRPLQPRILSTTVRKKGPKSPCRTPRWRGENQTASRVRAPLQSLPNHPSRPEHRTAPHNLEKIPGILNPRLVLTWVEKRGPFFGRGVGV